MQQKAKQAPSLLLGLQSVSAVKSLQAACKLGWEMQVRSPLCRKQCLYFACRVQMSRQGKRSRGFETVQKKTTSDSFSQVQVPALMLCGK